MTSIQITRSELQKFLTAHHFQPAIDPQTGQLFCAFMLDKVELILLITPAEEASLIQFVLFLPLRFSEATRNDLARLLHKFNNLLDLPGFCLEEAGESIYFRHVLPIPGKALDTGILLTLMQSIPHIAGAFFEPIRQVATGEKTFAEIE